MKRVVMLSVLLLFSLTAVLVAEALPGVLYVSAKSGLVLRDAPRTTGKQLALIPCGYKLAPQGYPQNPTTIGGRAGHWIKTSWLDLQGTEHTGWVFNGFLTDKPVAGVHRTSTGRFDVVHATDSGANLVIKLANGQSLTLRIVLPCRQPDGYNLLEEGPKGQDYFKGKTVRVVWAKRKLWDAGSSAAGDFDVLDELTVVR